jgi:hypothetical protein
MLLTMPLKITLLRLRGLQLEGDSSLPLGLLSVKNDDETEVICDFYFVSVV